MTTNWKESPQYQRIQEILEAYWLSEPDELAVGIYMEFIHADGESQQKLIIWHNPNYQYTGPERLRIRSLSDVQLPPPGYINEPLAGINVNDYRRKD